MSIHIPEYIDEMVDTTDPLTILLAREGSNDEAYQTACYYRSNMLQVQLRAEIEDNEETGTNGSWIRKTRKLSSKAIIRKN